jgi:glycosyltransferase involved in cell wall biosynthesis
MKILLVHKFWRKVGGAEVYFQDTARILRNHGHHVKIFTTDYNAEGSNDVYETTGDVVFGEAADYLKGNIFQRALNIPEIIYSVKNKLLFKKLLLEFKPDVVHVFAIYVTITPSILDACTEAGIPVVMSCNDYKHICPNYRLFHHGKICEDCKGGKFYKAVVNNCCKHSLAVSTISALESYSHERRNIYRKNIHTFLFESRFMMEKTKEFWNKEEVRMKLLGKPFDATAYEAHSGYENYILYAGRLSDEKGVDMLIKAMKSVPEANLKIAGEGPFRKTLEKEARGLHNVEFLGNVEGETMKDLFRNSRFVVIPSLWYENFPYILTESFALGKAVIGSDKGGIPEYIIPDETGYVYPSDDFNALSDLIRKMWNNPEKTVGMGLKAKEYADRNFNDSVFYKRLTDIYQNVLENYPVKPEFSA